MSSRVDRTNRTVLAVLGLVLLAAGGLGLARSLSWIGEDTTTGSVLPRDSTPAWTTEWWFWPAIGVGALVVAVLCAWWLVSQVSTERLGHLEVDPSRSGGDTWLKASSIAEAVQDEVEGYPGVSDARMQLLGTPGRHRHRLVVSLTDRADVDSVRQRLTSRTIPNIHRALDFDHPELEIELVLAPRERRRLS